MMKKGKKLLLGKLLEIAIEEEKKKKKKLI